ncbi:hypothetical protein [Thalassotalea fusca]
MITLYGNELKEVQGGAVAVGRAVARAVKSAGEAVGEWADGVMAAWLPIAKSINQIIR